MPLRYVEAMVHRHELQKQFIRVPAWEIPLLESLYAIEVKGEVAVDRDPPEPEAEYDRLERKYREFRDENGDYTGETVVGAVYGRFQAGIAKLADAISAAVIKEQKAAKSKEAA